MESLPAPVELDSYELIPIELIDEPRKPERETMDPEALAELALSIGDVGLIEPLIVDPFPPRFEVVAGHRRLLASRIAKLALVPCIVKRSQKVHPLAILVAENAHRENVNPIEEARFYQEVLVELCGNDVDVLCEMVRRDRGFVEDRLLLLQGWAPVIEALQEQKITLGVAKELNKVKFPNQVTLLLDAAVTQGATARTVAGWRKEMNADADLAVIPVDVNGAAAAGVAAVPAFQQLCFFCDDGSDPHLMVTVHMHKPCLKMVEKVLGRDPQSSSAAVN